MYRIYQDSQLIKITSGIGNFLSHVQKYGFYERMLENKHLLIIDWKKRNSFYSVFASKTFFVDSHQQDAYNTALGDILKYNRMLSIQKIINV